MQYMLQKERELVFETIGGYTTIKTRSAEVRGLIGLEKYFGREQSFVDLLLDQKVIKEFQEQVYAMQVSPQNTPAKYTTKFFTALQAFIQRESDFFG
jgi:hypothetical protein